MKKISFLLAFVLTFATTIFAQEANYQLSSHILDITSGQPAANVKITLSKQDNNNNWIVIDEKYTDSNGRIKDFLKQNLIKKDSQNNNGIYKLTYHTSPYFEKSGSKTFYPFIEVVFELSGNEHYHVPITLSPFGYSTYRGS